MEGKIHKLLEKREAERQLKLKKGNTVAAILVVIGCIVFLTNFLKGIIAIANENPEAFWYYLPDGILKAMLLFGFAEVIQLLQDIKDK